MLANPLGTFLFFSKKKSSKEQQHTRTYIQDHLKKDLTSILLSMGNKLDTYIFTPLLNVSK